MHKDKLSILLDSVASALVLVDQTGIIKYCNKNVEQIFGISAGDLIQCHINNLFLPTTRQIYQSHFEDFFNAPNNRLMGEEATFPAQHRSGKTIYITIDLTYLEFENKPCVLATISKVKKPDSATKKIERPKMRLLEKIEENKRILAVAENSSDAVYLLNQDCEITWVNPAALSLIGYRTVEVLSYPITNFLHQSQSENEIRDLSVALNEGLSFMGEVALATADGWKVPIDCSLFPVFGQDDLQGYVFAARNVSSRRKLEAQMRGNTELLETTARIAQLGFYSLDIKTEQLMWSEEVYKIHELPPNIKIEVENSINYYAPEARPIINEAVQRSMRTGESFDLELPFITAKGRYIWVRSVGYVEFKDGEPIKLKGAFQDITRLRQAAIDAEQAAQAKSSFLANMSHELRTPISGVLGISEILSNTPLDDKQKEYVSAISQSASTLLFLVNQVLDLAKLDSGSQRLNKRTFNLRQFMHETIYIHAVSAREKSCEFSLHIDDAVLDGLYTDSDRLRQVINNLCSNAIKFTESGSIQVDVRHNEDSELVITIKDSGIGINEDDIPLLFNEFQQIDNSYSRKHQGTGLGLTISKQLVELLGGKIGVRSKFGKGSDFWFSLPLSKVSGTGKEIETGIVLPSTLLLVEDEISANFWLEIAMQHKLKLRVCTDITEMLSELKSDKTWKIVGLFSVACDIPVQTCIASVLRVIGNHQTLLVNQGILALNELKKPNNDYSQIDLSVTSTSLAQPPIFEQFAKLLDWFSNQHGTHLSDWNGKRILIAEDNAINQLLFSEMLADTQAQVTIVENGQEALTMLEQDSIYDLVIMDCQMPVMDGFEATRRIREHATPAISNIRITAATAHGFEEDVQRCYEVGMNDVMVKPFSRTMLIDVISRNL